MSLEIVKKDTSIKRAKAFAFILLVASIFLAIGRTFIHPDLSGALMGISTGPVFYWLFRNPKIMLAKSFDEFCKLYDEARDMKILDGSVLNYLLVASVTLYIVFGRN